MNANEVQSLNEYFDVLKPIFEYKGIAVQPVEWDKDKTQMTSVLSYKEEKATLKFFKDEKKLGIHLLGNASSSFVQLVDKVIND